MLMAKTSVKKRGTSKKHSILIVDDHPIVRYGINRIIEQEKDLLVCGETENPKQTLDFLKKNRPDIIILDITLESVLDGLSLTKTIRTQYPGIPILVLSMHDEMTYAQKALASGANGYIMKEESSRKLVPAIREVLAGDIYVSSRVKKEILHSFAKPTEEDIDNIIERLSDRERQVFTMIGAGHTTRSISDKLSVSIKTVETHRSRIKFKLSIDTTPELVLAAAAWTRRERIAPAF